MPIVLKPCPFCGSDALTIEGAPDECGDDTGTVFRYAVFCAGNNGDCGCGPTMPTPDLATEAWNRRAAPESPKESAAIAQVLPLPPQPVVVTTTTPPPAETVYIAPPSGEPVAAGEYGELIELLRHGPPLIPEDESPDEDCFDYDASCRLMDKAATAILALQQQVAELIKDNTDWRLLAIAARSTRNSLQAQVAELQENYGLIWDAEYKGRKKIEELKDEIKQKHEKNSEIYGRLCKAEARVAELEQKAEWHTAIIIKKDSDIYVAQAQLAKVRTEYADYCDACAQASRSMDNNKLAAAQEAMGKMIRAKLGKDSDE